MTCKPLLASLQAHVRCRLHEVEGAFAWLLLSRDGGTRPSDAKQVKLTSWEGNSRKLKTWWAIPLDGKQLRALPAAPVVTSIFKPQDRTLVTFRIVVPKQCLEPAAWHQRHATPWQALKAGAPVFHSVNGFKEAVFVDRLACDRGRRPEVGWMPSQASEQGSAYFDRMSKTQVVSLFW